MNILLFGLHKLGGSVLESLVARHNIIAAVTKPSGPGSAPLIALGQMLGITVLQPESPKNAEFIRRVTDLRPDLTVVAGYHKIIPELVLKAARLGAINVHTSLLPKYRGPVPWKWAIINGEKETGITIHLMTPGLDNGDIIAQKVVGIDPEDTERTLFAKLSECGAERIAAIADCMETGRVEATPQNEAEATYYGYPSEEEMQVRWSAPATSIRNLVRGLNPAPGAWAIIGNRRVKIWEVQVTPARSNREPGTILLTGDSGVLVASASNDMLITSMAPDDRKQLQ